MATKAWNSILDENNQCLFKKLPVFWENEDGKNGVRSLSVINAKLEGLS